MIDVETIFDSDREETRAIAIEGVIDILKRIYTEGEPNGN